MMFKNRRVTDATPIEPAARPTGGHDTAPPAAELPVAEAGERVSWPAPAPQSVAQEDESVGVVLVGKLTIIHGEIGECKSIEIQGHVEGSVIAEEIVVRDGGSVNGTLTAVRAEIHGHVEGLINIRDLLDVRSTGRVYGELSYGRISIASGGHISGSIQRQEDEEPVPLHTEASAGRSSNDSMRQRLNDLDAFTQTDRWERLVAAE